MTRTTSQVLGTLIKADGTTVEIGVERVARGPLIEANREAPKKLRRASGAVIKGLATEPRTFLEEIPMYVNGKKETVEVEAQTAVVVGRISVRNLDLSRFEKPACKKTTDSQAQSHAST